MSPVTQRPGDRNLVAGRAFARTSPDGLVDGEGERGIYADDLRMLRRIEVFRAEREVPVAGIVTVDEDGCAVRFRLDSVTPGTGVLLVVELDGTDMFTIRDMAVEPSDDAEGLAPELGLGDARPDARMRLDVSCTGATLEAADGVALTDGPIRIDGTPRTASWTWRVAPSDAPAGPVEVELRAAWAFSSDSQPGQPRTYQEIATSRRAVVQSWISGRPVATGGGDGIAGVVAASIEDLETLRISADQGHVLAAGVPWFLTVFGRDSMLAAWMSLPIDPDLAASTLRHLAAHQATEYDLSIDAEPGKILHEERRGAAARRWHERYYGALDTTPLFLMLLAEHARWTGSDALARELQSPARAAVAWILSRIEEDELGLLGFWRRAERGLDIQSWKDSHDSQRDATGRVVTGRMRPLEVQGYAVSALRAAARMAASAWDDDVVGSEWNAAARLLERRFVERSLVELPPVRLTGAEDPRAGGFLAQSIDSRGLAVDSLCSNAGHLLWSDAIADPTLRARVVEQLTSDALDSGWGVRTMSTLDGGYDPTSYHCGSVWPHDTAICIAGIGRVDRGAATKLGRNLFDAAIACGGRLPEVFSGEARTGTTRPSAMPVACSPQAWASAAPLLVLRTLLALEPDPKSNMLLGSQVPVPEWLHGLRWRGVHALGHTWDVQVGSDGIVDVTPIG